VVEQPAGEHGDEDFPPVSGPAGEGDNSGRKRRRRGKRGGRRRGRGEGAGRPSGDATDDFAPDEGASIAAAERIEIVHQPLGSDAGRQGIETAFAAGPLQVNEETMDTAEAPVMDAGEAMRESAPPPFPAASESTRPQDAPPHDTARAEESAEPAATTASTIPDAKIVTEKPANPKRGWWQRLIDS